MSAERISPSKNESLEHSELASEKAEKLRTKIEKEATSAENNRGVQEKEIKETRKTVESEAISGKEIQARKSERRREPQNVTRAEKTRVYKSTLNRIQNQLPVASRGFSKFIHNPVVEKTSAAMSGTIARPSGILGAGTVGFFGFAIVLYFAKRNGFTIPDNSTLFILLILGGWLAGLLVEGIFKTIKKLTNR